MNEGDNMSIRESVTAEAAKASPSLSVGAMTLCGVPLSDVVLWATLLYTVLQAFFLIRDKWWRQRSGYKREE